MNQSTVEKIREYLKKREHTLDADLVEIFEEVMGRKPKGIKQAKPNNQTAIDNCCRANRIKYPIQDLSNSYRKYTGYIE